MKNILSLCLCALLMFSAPSSQAKNEISLFGLIDKKGEIISYGGVETNIKDEALLSETEDKIEFLAWAGIFYNCNSAKDIQHSDMLKFVEYVAPLYHSLPLEEFQKSPVVTLSGKEISDIIKNEFGEDYDFSSCGVSENELKLNCNLAGSNMIIGSLPLKIEKQDNRIIAVVLITNNDNKALAAMEYEFSLQNGKPVFKKAVRLKIKEQGESL